MPIFGSPLRFATRVWPASSAISAEAALPSHVGPFNWTIDRRDWAGWRDGEAPSVVAARYRIEANRTRKGIVLMHDYTADFPAIAKANRSAELTRTLVPMLIADGFRFVPLGA